MYLVIERKQYDNLPIEKRFIFIVKSFDVDYKTAQKKKEAFETINTDKDIMYSIVSFVDKSTITKVA